ncbi:MAG: cysteine--tRNA ligase [Nanoarchaeota archaeon]
MLKLYNTLTRKKEVFKPIKKGEVGMYTCGPTVYNYAHIGNFRTCILYDLIKRILLFNDFKVKHVMNITDVDDKTIKGSKKEGLSLKDFTNKYEKIFLEDLESLNVIMPDKLPRATEYIKEVVEIIKILKKKGYAYEASDGIYFSIDKSKGYGRLAQLDKVKKKKERIKSDEYDKENASDFALWKFYTTEDGNVFWDTEIGKGRPGWHIECSAMSTKLLGPTVDIHSGGMDLLFPHHTNEIAQSESATGKKFVKYWIHGAFLNMKEKMSKSLGNVITLRDLIKENYQLMHFRYLCLLTNYRKPLSFSFANLDSAKNAYEKLRRKMIELKNEEHKGKDMTKEYESEFLAAINDDLNMPLAVQLLWKVIDDFDFDSKKKLKLLEKFDEVFGLDIKNMQEIIVIASKELEHLMSEREKLRKRKKWAEADTLRERIREKGYKVIDSDKGSKLEKI